MKDYIFRGKQFPDAGGGWFYGSLMIITEKDFVGVSRRAISDEKTDDKGRQWHYYVDPETVGEYTGLTDRNGNRIFEGDILNVVTSIHGDEEIGVVTWDTDAARFVVSKDNNIIAIFENGRAGLDMEVIGNIHDNPELLEVLN